MPGARFRFYEELNDFLPKERKKVSFFHRFKDRSSVKDMIESLGIPHTEVDLILVNGESVDFSYMVQHGDMISVYPVFESLNINQVSKVRAEPLRETRFVLDIHLGRLARLLRMLGFDTFYRPDFTSEEIVQISLSEKRIILSKSRGLLKRREVTHGFCLNSSDPEEQAALVLKRFDLFNNITPFSRCIECNTILVEISAEDARNLVPSDILDRQERFSYCPSCRKVYWKGSHYRKMKDKIRQIVTR